jgi:hypothetical protein
MQGLALPRSQPQPHASINPSSLSKPPTGPNEIKQSQSQPGSSNGNGNAIAGSSTQGAQGGKVEKPVLTNVPEITVVEGLVPTLQ